MGSNSMHTPPMPFSCRCALVVAGAGLALWGTEAAQAQTRTGTVAPKSPAILVLSGGVSLGAYEAGYLYAISETAKASRGSFPIPLLTGASAGSANAFITAINLCSPRNMQPTEDLGWQTWIPMDYRTLFDKSAVTAEHIFSRAPLIDAFERIRKRWHQGLPKSCDVVVGATVTRLEAEPIRIRRNLFVPRQEEKFAFRIRGRGPGRAPLLTNIVDPTAHVPQPLLPFVNDNEDTDSGDTDSGDTDKANYNLNLVRDVVFASAAFPIAFSPVELTYCMTDPQHTKMDGKEDDLSCGGELRRDAFIDGGLFDNNPLRFAHMLADLGLTVTRERVRWLDRQAMLRARASTSPAPKPTFIYLDPDTFAYPPMEDEDVDSSPPGATGLLSQITSDFVATARAKELYGVVQGNEDLAQRMLLTISNYPMASGEIGAFMGFFDREFRRFDYYLGMFDAVVQSLRVAPSDSEARRAIMNLLTSEPEAVMPQWKPLTCMFGYYQPEYARFRSNCASEDFRDFRILIQATLDRVYSHCQQLDASSRKTVSEHHHCKRALQGGSPPQVEGLSVPDDFDYRKQSDEAHLDHFLRLLASYRFWFRDLGLQRDEAAYGRIKIRRKLLSMVEHIANAQDNRSDRALLLSAGRNAVNSIAYEPPKDWWYVGGGTAIEVGASFLPFDWNESWARLHAAAQLAGAETLFSPDPVAVRLSLTAGGELEPLFATTSLLQPILGVRAGWQFGNRDDFGFGDCTVETSLDDNRNCSQFALHSYVALGLLERFRLQLTLEWYPFKISNIDHKLYDVQFGFGFQFL